MTHHAPRITHHTSRQHWMLIAILLLAFALRLYQLGADSLWYDETVSVHLASKSLPDLVSHTARDIHPPGYYALLNVWTQLAGASEFSAAFLSLWFGVLLVALAYRLAVWVVGPTAGLFAAFLVAISPYNLWYSQEVRMYTLGAVLGLGVLVAVLQLLKARAKPASKLTDLPLALALSPKGEEIVSPPPGEGWGEGESGARSKVASQAVSLTMAPSPSWRWLAVYATCGALGLWVLYYFAFLLAAVYLMVGLWWLAVRRREPGAWGWLGRWALSQIVVLLLYAPWLPIAWRQATNPPVPPWRSFTGLGNLLVQTWSALSLGQSVEPVRVWPVLLLFVVLFVLGLLYRPVRFQKPDRSPVWFLAGYVFIPVLLIYLASLVTPLYHVRYAFTYAVPFYIIAGAGLAWLWKRWRPAVWVSLAVIVAFSWISIFNYHTAPRYASDDHRAATRFLAERWRPGDAILVNAGYTYTALLTYWDGDPAVWRGRLAEEYGDEARHGPLIAQTGTVGGDPSLGWGDPESDFYVMSPTETAEGLSRLFSDFHRVWVYRIYDTVTDPDGLIRAWLAAHGTLFEDQVFGGESQLRVQGFLTGRDPRADVEPPAISVETNNVALADGSLTLASAVVENPHLAVGDALDLALVWRVQTPLPDDTILFAGLFDKGGQRWAQTDERPLGSLYPVSVWPVGATTRTPVRIPLPAGTPPGGYRLEVGWYRFIDGQPLWLPWDGGARLALGDVEVVAPKDWHSLPPPELMQPVDVTIGADVRFLGFDAQASAGRPGETIALDLYWQALDDAPEAGLVVLQLAGDDGNVLAQASSAPAGGRAPFVGLEAGQVIRDPRAFTLPGNLAPGVYNLSLGRQRSDGTWLPIRCGLASLGSTYPLATIRVLDGP